MADEKETREGGGGAGGRNGEASEGVVPGSTNQRQDAIDRHVAPGWCNKFRSGVEGRQLFCLRGGGGGGGGSEGGGGDGEGDGGWWIERGKAAAAPVEDGRAAAGGGGEAGGWRTRVFCTLRYTYW